MSTLYSHMRGHGVGVEDHLTSKTQLRPQFVISYANA